MSTIQIGTAARRVLRRLRQHPDLTRRLAEIGEAPKRAATRWNDGVQRPPKQVP